MPIAYETSGAGSPIVLVHGITGSRREWEPIAGPLARTNTVIAVDLRGHGESPRIPPYDAITMAGDLREVIEATDAHNALLVGHSLGAVVVTIYAAQFDARAVINVDQSLEIAGFKQQLSAVEPLLRGDDASFRAVMNGLLATLYEPLSPAERARLEQCGSVEQDVVVGVWDMIMDMSADALDAMIREQTNDLRAPYLALHGDEPRPGYGEWLATLIPQSTYEVWPNHGHFLQYVDPERFIARVQAFDTQTQSRS